VVAADDSQVDHNTLCVNNTFGVIVANVCDAFHLGPGPTGRTRFRRRRSLVITPSLRALPGSPRPWR
jgi:hypothetical protein